MSIPAKIKLSIDTLKKRPISAKITNICKNTNMQEIIKAEAQQPTVKTVKLPDRIIDVVRLPDQPVFEIKYTDTQSLLNPDSDSFKIFKEAMLRDRDFTLKAEGTDSIGTRTNHLDANPQLFETLSELLNEGFPNQGPSTERRFTPEDIQNKINRGIVISKHPKDIGLIHSAIATLVKNSSELYAEAKKETPRSIDPVVVSGTGLIDAITILDSEKEPTEEESATQKSFNNLLAHALEKEVGPSKSKKDFYAEVESIALASKDFKNIPVSNYAQLLGFILRSFKYDIGKIQVTDPELMKNFEEFLPPQEYRLGGAAAGIANRLANRGENIIVTTPYHSERLSKAYTPNNGLRFLKFTSDNQFIIGESVTDPQVVGKDDYEQTNHPVEHKEGVKIICNGKTYEALEENRVIFKAPGFTNKNGEVITPKPTFDCSDETLSDAFKGVKVLMFTGCQVVQTYKTEAEYQHESSKAHRQLQIIRKGGTKVFIEFSGNTSFDEDKGQKPWQGIAFIEDVVKGNVDYFSANAEEYTKINKEYHRRYPEYAKDNPDTADIPIGSKDSTSIQKIMKALQKRLGCETIHAHEESYDITLTNATSKEQMNTISYADSLAKYIVERHIEGKPVKKEPDEIERSNTLEAKGYPEIINAIYSYLDEFNIPENERSKVINDIITTSNYYNPNGLSISLVVSSGLEGVKDKKFTGAGDTTGSVSAHATYKERPIIVKSPHRYNLSQFLRDTKSLT